LEGKSVQKPSDKKGKNYTPLKNYWKHTAKCALGEKQSEVREGEKDHVAPKGTVDTGHPSVGKQKLFLYKTEKS